MHDASAFDYLFLGMGKNFRKWLDKHWTEYIVEWTTVDFELDLLSTFGEYITARNCSRRWPASCSWWDVKNHRIHCIITDLYNSADCMPFDLNSMQSVDSMNSSLMCPAKTLWWVQRTYSLHLHIYASRLQTNKRTDVRISKQVYD